MKNRSVASPPGSAPTEMPASSNGLGKLDYNLLRRKLLGLTDPQQHPGETEKVEVKEAAIRLCSVLARLFGEDLDRMTLWSRIGSAVETAHAKTSDDDLDRFADLCLEHVQADPGQAAACDALTQLRQTWAVRTPEWRHAFLAYVGTHKFALLTHGRARWEGVKEGRVEL